MKGLLRNLFNAATVLSILLCVGTIGLWIRSYWGDGGSFKLAGEEWTWRSRNGRFVVDDGEYLLLQELRAEGIDVTRPLVGQTIRFSDPDAPRPQGTQVVVNYPFTALATALLPLWRLRARYRRKRPSEGVCCAQCGYNLRATPDRCPECGAIPGSCEDSRPL